MPEILPPVYEHCLRRVDSQGYVQLDANRYSVPERLTDQSVDVYKHLTEVKIYHQHKEVASHFREINQTNQKIKADGHHLQKTRYLSQHKADETERALLGQHEVLDKYIAEFKKRMRGRGLRTLSQLLHLQRTYPTEAWIAAVERSYTYGLYDVNRLENLILTYISGNIFNISSNKE